MNSAVDGVTPRHSRGSPTVDPLASPSAVLSAGDSPSIRAGLYIDGFNLYHAIDDLQQPHLKWLNYWALGELLIPKRSETLQRVVYCTARKKDDSDKVGRHDQFIKALRHYGVDVLQGHFIQNAKSCKKCSAQWQEASEKETDVNLALSIIDDAFRRQIDHFYLVTADSDQAATARLLRERFPQAKLTTVAPPGRPFSKSILAHAQSKLTLSEAQLERCLLPPLLVEAGRLVFRCPDPYKPPPGWVSPELRPSRK